MDSYIENFGNFDDHVFVQKLKNASLGSFVNSQISTYGFHDNWMRMVSGFLIKVPENERFTIINHLWKFNGYGQHGKSKMSSFKRLLNDLGFVGELTTYQRCESHKPLANYILKVKDQIPNNTWIFCLSMLSAILYTKSLVDKNIIKFLINRSDASVSFLDTVGDAMELLELCKPYFETNNEEFTTGFNFGYNSMVDFYNGLAGLLEEIVEPVVEPVAEPVVDPVVEPVAEPTVELAVELAVEPVIENTGLSVSGVEAVEIVDSEPEEVPTPAHKQETVVQQEQIPEQPIVHPVQDKPVNIFDGIQLEGVDMNDPSIVEALRLLTEGPDEYEVPSSNKHEEADEEDELYS